MRPIRCESNFNDIPPIGDTAKVAPRVDPATRDIIALPAVSDRVGGDCLWKSKKHSERLRQYGIDHCRPRLPPC
jgi:hypothetical protein